MALRSGRQVIFIPLLIMSVVLMIFLHGCARVTPAPQPPESPRTSEKKLKPYLVMGKWYYPISDSKGFVQRGKASWYGKKFHGRKTANGEIYDMYGISAAHKTLPLGTYVRVHNLENDRKMDLRINDRGPFVRDRIIDLSYGAANKLGVVGPGTADVRIVALGAASNRPGGSKPDYVSVDYSRGNFTFQVGAFREYDNARRLKQTLSKKYKNAHIITFDSGEGIFYRVRMGKFSTLGQAQAQRHILEADGYANPFIVAE